MYIIIRDQKALTGYGYSSDAGLIYFKSSLNTALNSHANINFHVKNQIDSGRIKILNSTCFLIFFHSIFYYILSFVL